VKVIVAHNRYQSATPSGENRIVDSEIQLLRDAGIDVIPFIEDSDELVDAALPTLGSAAAGPVLSPRGVSRFRRLLRLHEPDVVHLHNVFPLISPWVVRTAVGAGVPVVQTVHNYRHTCVAGTHLRGGRACEDCREHALPWPAVRHACYRGSRPQSAAMAIGQVVHRRTWRLVSRFLVASPPMFDRLVSTGISPDRLDWRPTFAEDQGAAPLTTDGGIAFVGRLDEAKGVDLLLKAWTPDVARRWGRLVIAGSGPMQGIVESRALDDPTVDWQGSLDSVAVRKLMRAARLIAIPSMWLEGFPRVAAEAMSLGRPLLVWDGAGLGRLADFGAAWTIEGEPEAWSRRLLELPDVSIDGASRAARDFYDAYCSPDVALRQLESVYQAVARVGVST
jgi:glycosyltransferase involved in cell wall biosynthesis